MRNNDSKAYQHQRETTTLKPIVPSVPSEPKSTTIVKAFDLSALPYSQYQDILNAKSFNIKDTYYDAPFSMAPDSFAASDTITASDYKL